MIEVVSLRKGTVFTENDELFKVIDYSHTQKARGGATIRVKVRNLCSGFIVEKTFKSGGRVQDVRLEHIEVQYMYNDGDLYHFMNTETFEQFSIDGSLLEEKANYIVENMVVTISSYQDQPLDVKIPVHVDIEVIEADPSFAGNTAQSPTKAVKVSTGLVIQTPIFIDAGDIIRIDTRTGEYLARVNR